MVNEPWRQGVQVEVAHAVAAHHHGGMLTAEGIDDGLQRLGAGVEVVRIQLYGKASAVVVVDGHVPAAANAEVRSFWFQNDEWRVALHFRQYFSRAVGRVVIHHDDVIGEGSLL